MKEQKKFNLDTRQSNLKWSLFLGAAVICFASPAYADWFKVGDIKDNMISPVYSLIKDNLGFISFAVGGASTVLARGQDMYQKAVAFGIGALGTAASVKLAETVMHLA